MGLSAAQLKKVWELGMSSSQACVVCQAAMCMFAYAFNGLRESSVCSTQARNVEFRTGTMTARLSIVKGRPASCEPLVRFTRSRQSTSPLDLCVRFKSMRGAHQRFFAQPGDPERWSSGMLSKALEDCLAACGIVAPLDCKYKSHSLRCGSHTEQVLLGIPPEVRLALFGCGSRSSEMASVYFDRTICSSAESVLVLSAAVPASVPRQAGAVSTPPQ